MRLIWLILLSLRPRQWTKNLLLFPALVFSKNLFRPESLGTALSAFLIFCLLSGSVYLFNDLIDRKEDRRHPEKAKRPIAAGTLPVGFARGAMILIASVSLGSSLFINFNFAGVVSAYFLLQIIYSLWLKQIVLLDIFAIASGFFLRVFAGAEAICVPISSWLLLCAIFLSLFLALGKRRSELVLSGKGGGGARPALTRYNLAFVDQMVSVATTGTVLSYSLYTLSPETVEKFQSNKLWLTIPIVLFGIFRYLFLVYQKGEGGSPENILLADTPLISGILLYLLVVVYIVYL
jgi:4-hydroxybenzoate polyprenyltransferase